MLRLFGLLSGFIVAAAFFVLIFRPDMSGVVDQLSSAKTYTGEGLSELLAHGKQLLDEKQDPLSELSVLDVDTSAPVVAVENDTVVQREDDVGPMPVDAVAESSPVLPPRQAQFWSPFRSAYTAQGFADHIGRESGVDLAVVKLSPSKFRVAFDYRGEQQFQKIITRLEMSTGMPLEESVIR
ncbi:MAG: hypothetical protein GY696_29850 [Gammaproteobacteria bacterium]|nr:hypothetical protein [Gammaproteobacteria bacterium]